jgi:type III secretory pathway lipoprotein EscJ
VVFVTSFIFGLVIGAVGVMVAAYFVYRVNSKKIKAAVAILEGPGTPEEKIKQIKALFGL